MNDKKLIELVRSYPVLYDISDPKYMDTELKNALWNKIGEEIKTSGASCKTRWGNIRDNFRKSLKKTKNKNVKFYKYSEQLSFLKKFFEERETSTNIDDEITIEDVAACLSSNEAEWRVNEVNTQEYKPEANNAETVESQRPTPKPTGSIQCFIPRKKVKKQLVSNATPPKPASSTLKECLVTENERVRRPTPPALHPVDAFLSGIAPALKKLPPHYWHYAKADIFAAVQKYEFKMLMDQQQIPESCSLANYSITMYSDLPSPTGSSQHSTSANEYHSTTSTGQSQQ